MRQPRCSLLGCISSLLVCSLALAQDPAPEEQLAAVDAAIGKIQTWLEEADNNRSSLETELRANTRQLDTLNGEVTDNRQSIATLTQTLDSLNTQADTLEREREAQTTLIAQAVRASYLSGREPYLKLLLNQQNPAASARMTQYYQRYNRARLDRIEQFRDTLSALEHTRQETEAAAQQLQQRQQSLDAQLQNLLEHQAERERLLLALTQDIASRSDELTQLNQDREHLEALIQQVGGGGAHHHPVVLAAGVAQQGIAHRAADQVDLHEAAIASPGRLTSCTCRSCICSWSSGRFPARTATWSRPTRSRYPGRWRRDCRCGRRWRPSGRTGCGLWRFCDWGG